MLIIASRHTVMMVVLIIAVMLSVIALSSMMSTMINNGIRIEKRQQEKAQPAHSSNGTKES